MKSKHLHLYPSRDFILINHIGHVVHWSALNVYARVNRCPIWISVDAQAFKSGKVCQTTYQIQCVQPAIN